MEKLNFSFINKLMYLGALLIIVLIVKNMNLTDKLFAVVGSLSPFYIAFFISWISQPMIGFFQKKFNMSKGKASTVTLLIALLIVLLITFVFLPLLVYQIVVLISDSTNIASALNVNINKLISTFDIQSLRNNSIIAPYYQDIVDVVNQNINNPLEAIKSLNFDYITNLANGVLMAIVNTFKNVILVVIQIVMAFIMSAYLIKDFESFVQKTLGLFFSKSKSKHRDLFIDVTNALFGYFRGLFLDCSFVAIIVAIGTMLIGVQSPLFFGLIAGIFNIIPYLGPILGGVPLFFIALSHGYTTALLALLVIFGTQFVESNFLQPRIMAKSTNLHPVTVMVGLIVFQQLFGFVGMIIATPTLAIISVILGYTNLDIKL